MCPNQLCSLAILLSCTCCFVVVVVVVVFFQVSCYRTYSRATRGAYFTRLWRCSVIVCTTFSRTTGSPYCLTSTRWLPSRTQTRINSTSGKLPGSTHCVENPDNFPLLACENSRLALGGFRPPPPSRETGGLNPLDVRRLFSQAIILFVLWVCRQTGQRSAFHAVVGDYEEWARDGHKTVGHTRF